MKNWKQYKNEIKFSKNGWVDNWFSNMIEVDIIINEKTYKSIENYYQSEKMTNDKDKEYIANLSPQQSKKEARKLSIRKDWDTYKFIAMRTALEAKFSIPKWKKKLLSTGNDMIIEWNNWNDKFWGVSINDNLGHNHLGLMLMDIRQNYKLNNLFLIKKK